MNRVKILSAVIVIAAFVSAKGAPADFYAKDLAPLTNGQVKCFAPDKIVWIKDGKATMPIVAKSNGKHYGPRGWEPNVPAAASWLADSVFEMTGVKPEIILETEGKTVTNSPAVYIGTEMCKHIGAVYAENRKPVPESEEFRVISKDGSLYFLGLARHGVFDFGERYLGIRQYWDAKAGGRSVVKADTIALPEIDYSDKPVYQRRLLWPYESREWYFSWKAGNSWSVHCDAHQPYKWWGDTNFNYRVTRPEIFQLGPGGTRQPPMLCYGNPKTLETYKERLELELAGGPAAGMYNASTKTVTVSQWDALVDCQCEYCKPLYDNSRGVTGNASPIIWGFAAKLADWLHEKHPDITVTILPYLNTCDIPEGLSFPYKNVEAEVCSMPGLALFKNEDVRQHEEDLIKGWTKITGRPVRGWNYICWPAEFCNAPYLFGHTAIDHLKRMRGYIVGEFMNGPYPEERLVLSSYIWMRAMWNPELDAEAIYDVFAERMFGKAASQMRKIIAMQETGWNRQWGAGQISNKNVYEVSYPRKEVQEMESLFAEARKSAEGDEVVLKRIDWYAKGFTAFFEESEKLASGTALEPTLIKKVASDPVVDGKLDDDAWNLAIGYPFVHARNKDKPEPKYPTTVKMVWTPNGVTFGFLCTEPYTADEELMKKVRSTGPVEEIELFIDPSGTCDGHYYQIFTEDNAHALFYTDGPNWMPKGIKVATAFGKGTWSMEVFVPFDDLRDFPNVQMPSGTSAEGKFWIGNVMRNRRWDSCWAKDKKLTPDTTWEFSRRYTRYSMWSKDASAFGKLQFVE